LTVPGLQALRFRVLFFDVVEIKDFKLMFFWWVIFNVKPINVELLLTVGVCKWVFGLIDCVMYFLQLIVLSVCGGV
jgi:hypothetical protein